MKVTANLTGTDTNLVRRRTVLAGGAAFAIMALAGCSQGGSTTAANPKVQIVWRGDAKRAESVRAALDLFSKSHAEYELVSDYQSGNEYLQKLAVRFASQDAPDLLRQERDTLREYGDRDALLDLNKHKDVLNVSGIPESALSSGIVGDQLLGIPGGLTSLSYVVNTALFEKFGVKLPDTSSWSWDDYANSAAELTRASGGTVWGTDFPVIDLQALGVYLRQHGEDVWTGDGKVAFNKDTVKDWFQLWVDMRDSGALPPAGALDVLGGGAEQSPIGLGKIASTILPPNNLPSYNATAGGTLALADFPGERQAKQRGQQLIPSMYWSVGARTKFPAQTAALLDFLVNDVEANRALKATHGLPASSEVATAVAKDLGKDDQTWFDYILTLGKDKLITPTPSPAGTSQVWEALTAATDELKFDRLNADQAAEQFTKAAEEALGR